jgi:hypothetical protein
MDATSDTYFGLQIVLDHTFGMLNNSPLILTIPYKSTAAATQSEIAANLAIIANAVMKRQAGGAPVKVERINSGAQLDAVAAGGAATAVVTKGSKQLTFSGDQSTVVFAGSILRLGTGGAGTGPCYIVESIAANGLDVVLDQEYQGASDATFAHGTIETVTEGDWGLKFTGVSVTDANFNPITDEPFVVSFTLGVRDFATATATYTTKAVLGSGTYQQLSALEAYCQFQRKTKELSLYPPTKRLFQAVVGESYHLFSFDIVNDAYASTTTGVNPKSFTKIIIAEDKDLTEAFDTVLAVTILSAII